MNNIVKWLEGNNAATASFRRKLITIRARHVPASGDEVFECEMAVAADIRRECTPDEIDWIIYYGLDAYMDALGLAAEEQAAP